MQGIVHAKGARPSRVARSPNLQYRGGEVMHSGAQLTAIYWGPSWTDASGYENAADGGSCLE